ncbi:MAG: N-acetylmuramoyl-L-alanine amidase [Candidatus Gastranaerophilales bacterium]|nr:N-acetylmuramoyl-L-alanine amidase [Candidatus Gastranaerophilales bacterium]
MAVKFLKLLLVLICFCFQMAFADVMKVNDITFDSSDSIIFVSTSNSDGDLKIKKGHLSNPDRIYIDIENAVLTKKQTLYEFRNGKLSSLRISQFSTNPHVVRIVMTYTSKFKPEDLKVMSVGGNIILKLENYKLTQDYLTQVYREVKSSTYDYFEKVQVQEAVPPQVLEQIVLNPAEPNKSNVVQPKVILKDEPVRVNPAIQESKLRSRYFVADASVKQGALLISGTGIVNLEKVFYLSNPSRVVFDIPNAVSAGKIRNKTFTINETENAKIGQFEPTKVRIVITSPDADKYRAVYSGDLQNILIVRDDKIAGIKLFAETTKLLSAKVKTKKEYRTQKDTLSLDFEEPVVYSIKRNGNTSLDISLYNVTLYSIPSLLNQIQQGNLKNAVIDKLNGGQGIRILIPITDKTTLDCVENLQSTKLVFNITNPLQQQQKIGKGLLNKKIIVLDPGHGGTDPGAMRESVMEKHIVLEIAKLVEQKLKNQGATVYMSRSNDTFVSLSDRVVFSNNRKPDVFVSIHINASENSSVHGIETHYYKDDSIDLAKHLHKSIIQKINDKDRGIIKSRFYVIRNTDAPSVLLELGFISNEQERELMQTKERQEALADAITEGLINCLSDGGTK